MCRDVFVCKATWKETQPTCIDGIEEAKVGMLVDFHTHNLIPYANALPALLRATDQRLAMPFAR